MRQSLAVSKSIRTFVTGNSVFFYDESKSVIRKLIVKSKPVFKGADLPSVSVYAINFMQKFLTKDPDKRMTVEQALKHKWFQVFNKENIMKINQSINTKLNENKNNITNNRIFKIYILK